jgi:hypothetical protein
MSTCLFLHKCFCLSLEPLFLGLHAEVSEAEAEGWRLCRPVYCCINVFVAASSLFSSASMPKSVKLKLKGGGYVDPESGLEDKVRMRYVLLVFKKTGVCGDQYVLITYSGH